MLQLVGINTLAQSWHMKVCGQSGTQVQQQSKMGMCSNCCVFSFNIPSFTKLFLGSWYVY